VGGVETGECLFWGGSSATRECPALTRLRVSVTIALCADGLRRGTLAAVPPASAQGLKQRGRVGITIRPCLGEADHRLLVGLFGHQQRNVTDRAQLQSLAGDVEALGRRAFRAQACVQRGRIEVKSVQDIGNVTRTARRCVLGSTDGAT